MISDWSHIDPMLQYSVDNQEIYTFQWIACYFQLCNCHPIEKVSKTLHFISKKQSSFNIW